MGSFLMWAVIFILYLGIPMGAVVWFLRCLGNYRSAVPFTEEKERAKRRLIPSAIIAGVLAAIVVISLFVYLFTVFL